MKVSRGEGGLGAQTAVVILVLLFGATVYLWRARYIRPVTAYVLMALYVVAIGAIAIWSYRHPM
jgi:hypothetical protein